MEFSKSNARVFIPAAFFLTCLSMLATLLDVYLEYRLAFHYKAFVGTRGFYYRRWLTPALPYIITILPAASMVLLVFPGIAKTWPDWRAKFSVVCNLLLLLLFFYMMYVMFGPAIPEGTVIERG